MSNSLRWLSSSANNFNLFYDFYNESYRFVDVMICMPPHETTAHCVRNFAIVCLFICFCFYVCLKNLVYCRAAEFNCVLDTALENTCVFQNVFLYLMLSRGPSITRLQELKWILLRLFVILIFIFNLIPMTLH